MPGAAKVCIGLAVVVVVLAAPLVDRQKFHDQAAIEEEGRKEKGQ